MAIFVCPFISSEAYIMIVISIASSGVFTIASSRLGIFTFANRKAIALLHFVALVGAKSAILMGDAVVTVTKKLN